MGRIIWKQTLLLVLLWQGCTSLKKEIYIYIYEAKPAVYDCVVPYNDTSMETSLDMLSIWWQLETIG